MTVAMVFGVLAVMFVLPAVPAFAADEEPAVEMPRPVFPKLTSGSGEGKVTLDVVERPLKDVVDYIRDLTEVNLFVAPEAEEQKVTIKVRNLPWRTFLDLVAEKTGCVLDSRDPSVVKIERPPRVTFTFEDTDVKKVIQLIADYSGANVIIAPHVEGTVNVSLRDIPWRDALDTIVKTLGYTVVEEERGILRIMSPSMLKEQLETEVFTFKFIRPPDPIRGTIKSSVAVGSIAAPDSKDVEKEFPLLKAFRAAVAPGGTLEYIKASNSIVVTATRPKLNKLVELIQEVDNEPSQVFVDMQFVTTSNTDFLDVGLDPGEDGLSVAMSFGDMTHRLPFNLGDGGWLEGIAANPVGPEALPSGGFNFGKLDFTKTQLALRLLKQDKSSKVVQAPKLIALDNQEATIFVGETIRYAKTEASSSQSGGLEYAISEAENSPVQTGFQLLVIPHVIPGTDRVIMTVVPKSVSLTGTSTTLPGFDEFRTGSGVSEVSILLPRESSAEMVTHMVLDSGETAVLGGLLTDRDAETVNAIPFLGEIPVIGWLFKNERKTKTKDHLIVFITPRLLESSDAVRSALQRELEERRARITEEYNKIRGVK
jgi:type IV pilus assembly protein PilQ